MDRQWTRYLALPAEITPFERDFLARLNKVALVFFSLHLAVVMAVAWAAGTGVLQALAFSLVVITGPAIAYLTIRNPRSISVVHGVAAMLMGGLLVHLGVVLILDIESQAARTALRSGRSVRRIAGPHRSLRARARICMMC